MGGANQTEVAFIDQVGERNALILVLLGHRDDEAQVTADQLVERFLFADADAPRQAYFFLLRNERVLTDLA
jgi:hypothetical protein